MVSVELQTALFCADAGKLLELTRFIQPSTVAKTPIRQNGNKARDA